MLKIKNYIGGVFLEPKNKKYIDNSSPTNGVKYSLVPDSNSADVDLAVGAAKRK